MDTATQRSVKLTDALQSLRQQLVTETQQEENAWQDIQLRPAVLLLLAQLAAYWDRVGASERLMALHPPPVQLFQSVMTAADLICAQLASGCSQCGQYGSEEEQHSDQPEQAVPRDFQPLAQIHDSSEPVIVTNAGPDHDLAGAAALAADIHDPSWMEDLLDASADLVVGWCGILGAGAAGRTTNAVQCGIASLAAAVLLCSCSTGARRLVERWGVVLLDDVLTTPRVRLLVLPCSMPLRLCACTKHCPALS